MFKITISSISIRAVFWAYKALFYNSLRMAPPGPKHAEVLIIVINCILSSAFVGGCIDCRYQFLHTHL
jgi:hypothetical protein